MFQRRCQYCRRVSFKHELGFYDLTVDCWSYMKILSMDFKNDSSLRQCHTESKRVNNI